MHYTQMLLSKAIDDNNVQALTKYGITARDCATEGDRQTLLFIRDYADKNRGQAPGYATVTAECPDFVYTPQVSDGYDFLAREIKKHSAMTQFAELANGKLGEQFDSVGQKDIFKYFEWLQSELERIKIGTSVRESIGRTLDEIKESVKDEFLKREAGKSAKQWDTPFASLTAEISGWFSGDIYGILGESGRGKSYLMAKIIDSLLRQGANVLWKSYEVKEYISIARLVSIATAVDEVLLDDLGRKVGIPNRQILTGKLDDVVREHFMTVIDTLDSYYPGKLFFQGKSGTELTRTLDDLDRELSTGLVDAVVLDPFYGLADVYGKNVNKTSGGAAEYAATRFENIVGDHDVVGFYTVQATVEKKQTDEAGARELRIPTRDKVKTSARLLDIATNLIGFDSVAKEGIAGLGIEKGRNGGEDFMLELVALFDYGVLKEFPQGEAAVSQFDF